MFYLAQTLHNLCHDFLTGRSTGSDSTSAQSMDLRALSSAIMAAVEKADLVAHETNLWLNDQQKFNNLDRVSDMISEAEV